MKSFNSVDNLNNGTDVNNAGNVNSAGNVNNAGNANNASNQSNVKKESNDSGALNEKVALIYMAAGNSRRFGENKLLYKINLLIPESNKLYKYPAKDFFQNILLLHFIN